MYFNILAVFELLFVYERCHLNKVYYYYYMC